MKVDKLRVLHNLFHEFTPLYHQKFTGLFKKIEHLEPRCHKNQIKSLFIIKKKGKITPTTLGKYLDMRKGSLTSLVDSLQELGLLKREPDPKDRRKIWLSLTDNGDNYLKLVMEDHQKHFAQVFDTLSAHELQTFINSLQQVVNILKKA